MELSPEQCAVIATAIPVLLVAIVVEYRLVAPREWARLTTPLQVIASGFGFITALRGVDDGLSATVSTGPLAVTVGSFALLAFTAVAGSADNKDN